MALIPNKAGYLSSLALLCGPASGCGDDVEAPIETNPNEVITTVTLTFTPSAGGEDRDAQFRDADGPGGADPEIRGVTVTEGETYTMTVEFLNELEDPAEDITPEIFNERDEHQTFLVGPDVEGPATSVTTGALIRHGYDDTDTLGLPIGLTNTVEALAPGSTQVSFGLRHMPLVNQEPQKRAGLEAEVADAGGFDSENAAIPLPGSWDVVVDLPLTVEAP